MQPKSDFKNIPKNISEVGSDYYLRHPELRASGAIIIDTTVDYFLWHPEWVANAQNAVVPVTGNSETSDYFQRHYELSAPILAESLETPGLACESPVDCR